MVIDDVGETDGVLEGVIVCEAVTEGVRDVDEVGEGVVEPDSETLLVGD